MAKASSTRRVRGAGPEAERWVERAKAGAQVAAAAEAAAVAVAGVVR